jgi:NAD(P)H-hydrate epimerase
MTLADVTTAPLPRLPARAADSHKGDYGRALLIGGSRGMSGAIALAGLATLRSGAGLVTVAVPRSIQDIVASFCPCYMTIGLDDDGNGRVAKSAIGDLVGTLEISKFGIASPTAIGFGPGLGRDDTITELAALVYQLDHEPMVVDADALYALAQRPEAFAKPAGPRVLTPHPGEFQRLTGQPHTKSRRVEVAAELARGTDDLHYQYRDKSATTGASSERFEMVVVLKGHQTVVTDGHRYSINQTGNPGMATGGTGDVLTGVITGLLCQGLSPFDAARLGTHVHGLAGDLAAKELGQVSLIASDVIDYLPAAFQSLLG